MLWPWRSSRSTRSPRTVGPDLGSPSPCLRPGALAMAEVPKLLYILVVDEGKEGEGDGESGKEWRSLSSFRYTRPVLQSTLQLMGCKPRHAFKISRRVFDVMRDEYSGGILSPNATSLDPCKIASIHGSEYGIIGGLDQANAINQFTLGNADTNSGMPFELYKRLTTVVISRECFLKIVCDTLALYKYVGPNQRADLLLACRIRERKESVTVLLCGTSGCGKSTLSALLGSRLGVTTVISTDSIRHMMRSYADEKQNPLLWASTYHAGECLDAVAVAEAKAKRKAKKLAVVSHKTVKEGLPAGAFIEKPDSRGNDPIIGSEFVSKKQMAIEGFKAQSEMVIDSLDRLITAWEKRKESVVVEGVHLSLNFVMGLMKKHPSIIPFMIYITSEDKHMERFAVRAKYMTLDPSKNRYVKYIQNIRAIQEYHCNRADKHLVPKINNTNVDKSVAAIHATVFGCLRRREAGEQLYDPTTNTVSIIHEEYRNQCKANSLSSKGMFQLIQRKGSSRHLMALLNKDGSVAKAWPVESIDQNGRFSSGNGSEKCMGGPMYGPLQIGKAEPVNLQFGHFGISAWPNDTCGTSQAGSIDDSKAEGTDTGSRYVSSCCSSPKALEGPAKELKEEIFVSGSEEEADYAPDGDSDEDLSDFDKKEIEYEIEGSVDEDSKSDEEYEDLAMRDGLDHGYWSDDDDSTGKSIAEEKFPRVMHGTATTKYQCNLDLFLKMSKDAAEQPFRSPRERNEKSTGMRVKRRSLSDSLRFQDHTQNIPVVEELRVL